MLITRTPLRISIGGGGTDLPSYYAERGGFVVSAAIDKYIYVGINKTFTGDYVVKYSQLERVPRPEDVEHPIVRTALELHPVGPAEIVSLADIPAGTGLGSSGAFTVGVLKTLYAYHRKHVTASDLAEEACRIEIDLLSRPVGKQDQYIAAFGGITCFEIDPNGRVHVSPLGISTATVEDLEEHLLMFFTGYSRDADAMLADQRARTEQRDAEMVANLDAMKELGLAIRDALEAGETIAFAELMHAHWERKRGRSRGMTNSSIDRWYEVARASGAVGGKLVGAGAGGFLLLYAADPKRVRSALAEEGLMEVRFAFDHDGSQVIVRG